MKALVIGGCSGIGLSIVLNLSRRTDYDCIYVLDKKVFPTEFRTEKIKSIVCDLSTYDDSYMNGFDDIQSLFITAGFGHLKLFQELTQDYIHNIFSVNAIAPIQIIRHFYERLLSKEDFYCAIMVSIAGRLSSPLFSVYSATKSALSKFIEAINIELEVQGSKNRVLEVSPGSIMGTGFSGGVSDPEQTKDLAEEIIDRAYSHEELFIPQYEEIYKDVIKRYETDAHSFGIDSFWYKMKRAEQG